MPEETGTTVLTQQQVKILLPQLRRLVRLKEKVWDLLRDMELELDHDLDDAEVALADICAGSGHVDKFTLQDFLASTATETFATAEEAFGRFCNVCLQRSPVDQWIRPETESGQPPAVELCPHCNPVKETAGDQ